MKDYLDEQERLMKAKINANVFGENNTNDFRDNVHANVFRDNNVNPFANNGNNTPPKTPRSHLDVFVSLPRSSHHGHASHKGPT